MFALYQKNTEVRTIGGIGILPTPLGIAAFVLLVVTAWSVLWTTWYKVDQNENAVVQFLGKYVRTETNGLHGKMPWPFEKVTKVSVTDIYQMEVGFRTLDSSKREYKDLPEEAEMLTADMNIAYVDWVVQFKTSDAKKFLFNVKEPVTVLRYISQSAMRNVVGGKLFDDIATSGRQLVQEGGEKMTQELLDQSEMGLVIAGVQLQDAHPPEAVRSAFKDVTNALEDKGKLVQQAEGYRNKFIPEARGHAKGIIEKATGYRNERIARAEGDADRFLALLAKY
jgi:membrane protease subunit HflK